MISLWLALSLFGLCLSMKTALSGRQPVLYCRVSTKEQKKTLTAQETVLLDWLKQNGIKRKPKVFKEQVSGTSEEPPMLLEAIAYCVARPGKTFLLVRDFQRISRNWRFGAANMIPLWKADVPVVSALTNQVSNTSQSIQDNDFLIGLFMALGAQEVDQVKKRTAAGTAAARALGIIPGTTLDFYLKDSLNPYRELRRLLQAGVGQTEGSRRLNKSTSWWRKRREFFREVMERGGEEAIENWLTTTDRMRERLATLDLKKKDDKKKERALKRMTSGFLKFPYEFPMPSEEQLDEFMQNFQLYQPKRTK